MRHHLHYLHAAIVLVWSIAAVLVARAAPWVADAGIARAHYLWITAPLLTALALLAVAVLRRQLASLS